MNSVSSLMWQAGRLDRSEGGAARNQEDWQAVWREPTSSRDASFEQVLEDLRYRMCSVRSAQP